MPALTVVAPCFNEAEGLPELHRRVSAACRAVVGEDYEIIIVNDGSRDDTWRITQQLSGRNPRVKGINLMRNHGHQLAVTAGLAMAEGQRVLLIDADLQDPPELLADMMQLMDSGADVVYGKRASRRGESRFKMLTAFVFYRMLSRLTNVPIPEDTGDFRLMRRRIVDALLAMPEHGRFVRGMVSWVGGRQVPILYERATRYAGKTKYPIGKMVRFAISAITSFSTTPLRLAVWLGMSIAALAALLLFYSVWQWVRGSVVSGWSSTMTAMSLFAGVQLIVLGIIGEYLGVVVDEVKGRPLFLVDEIVVDGRCRQVALKLPAAAWAERERVSDRYAFVTDSQLCTCDHLARTPGEPFVCICDKRVESRSGNAKSILDPKVTCPI
jgi:glycosyltransferase involved in cell wall biosynthesis